MKKLFYQSIRLATIEILDCLLEIVEEEEARAYRDAMEALPPVRRRFRLLDVESGRWIEV